MFRLGEFSGAEAGACEGSATSFGAFDGRVGAEKCVGLGLRVGAVAFTGVLAPCSSEGFVED